ncbi:MAG: penicillin acylase family protein [Candidatus Marinimicrobia bacterium]|nr:penicillin acylase family protein [Candidatus Neomarinimicrobiota bacterium]
MKKIYKIKDIKVVLFVILIVSFSFSESVEIIRDNYGIPHIIGDTPRDCAFGLTIAMYQDHPKSLIDNLLTIRGELSRHYGTDFFNQDAFIRSLQLENKTMVALNTLSPEILEYLKGLANGINYSLENFPENAPSEIDINALLPITVIDLYSSSYLKSIAHEWNQFVKDAGSYYSNQSIFPNAQEDMSNQWVITPERTADNALYILCDPHLPFNGLTASWSAHVKSLDGLLNYNGFYFIGSPHPIMGHNEHFAWSHTANKPDFADAFLVSLDPNNDEHYLLDGISKPFNLWTEIISFPNGTNQQVTIRQSPDHGVYVKMLNSSTMLFAKLEVENNVSSIEQGYRVMTAQSVNEWENALSLHQYDKWNCLGGDEDGNILFIYNGIAHYRNNPVSAREGALDASTSSTLWQDLIPFSTLPRVENPVSGYLQNCNDSPWYVTPNPGFGQDEVPIEIWQGDYFGTRGKRITELIELGGDTMSVEYLKRIALDIKILGWDSLKQIIPLALDEAYADAYPFYNEADSLANILFNWDGFAEKSSTEMSLLFYLREVLPSYLEFINPFSFNESDRRILVESLVSAKNEMISKYGTLEIPWGDIHRYFRGNESFPISGAPEHSDLSASRMGKGMLKNDNVFHCNAGNDHILLIRLKPGESPQSWFMKPNGQSEDPNSPHYNDLTYFYSQDSLLQNWYTESDYLSHAESNETHYYTPSGNIQGDINGDGIVNILDIVLIIDVILENEYIELADVDNDGNVNVIDIVLLVNIILNN